MYEDLRKEVEESGGFDDEVDNDLESMNTYRYTQDHFLGMTPLQRFIIALMLFLIVLISSALWLLVTERIVPPWLY
jgi:hypothetical protein